MPNLKVVMVCTDSKVKISLCIHEICKTIMDNDIPDKTVHCADCSEPLLFASKKPLY